MQSKNVLSRRVGGKEAEVVDAQVQPSWPNLSLFFSRSQSLQLRAPHDGLGCRGYFCVKMPLHRTTWKWPDTKLNGSLVAL